MKVKVPNEIQIGCHSYQVFLKDKNINDYDGDTYFIEQMIRVRKDLPPTQKGATFLHEAIHFINQIYNCKLDERDTDLFAQGLAQLLYADLGIELDWSGIKLMTTTVK